MNREKRERLAEKIGKNKYKRPGQATKKNRIEALEKRINAIEEYLNLDI